MHAVKLTGINCLEQLNLTDDAVDVRVVQVCANLELLFPFGFHCAKRLGNPSDLPSLHARTHAQTDKAPGKRLISAMRRLDTWLHTPAASRTAPC